MNMKDDATPIGVSVKWKDKHGHTAQVQGDTVFTSDNEDAVVVGVDENGKPTVGPGPMTATGEPDPVTGVIATVTITAMADADLGEGTRVVSAVGAVVLIAGDAVTGEITFG